LGQKSRIKGKKCFLKRRKEVFESFDTKGKKSCILNWWRKFFGGLVAQFLKGFNTRNF